MKHSIIKQTGFYFIFVVTLLSCKTKEPPILNENFDNNTMGWIEESSDFHSLKIDSGFYYIHSKDTTDKTYRTSTASLQNSYLIALPEEYEIETRVKLIESNLEDVSYGIILRGATLEYSIDLHMSGKVEVVEYDYNSGLERKLISSSSNYSMDENAISIKLAINKESFILLVNNYVIGNSEFNVKSWQDLRIFTSKQSKIAVDFLRIQHMTLESIENS